MTPEQQALDKLKVIPKRNKDDEDEDKWPKQAALYICRPGRNYTCSECAFAKENATKCALYGMGINIRPMGACGLWVENVLNTEMPFYLPTVSKLESGYMNSKEGFGCRRCEYYENKTCKKVDQDSPGDTPGIISPQGCCNRFDPK